MGVSFSTTNIYYALAYITPTGTSPFYTTTELVSPVGMEKKPILRKPIYTKSEKNYNPVRKKLCLQIGSGFRIVFDYTFITLLPRGIK